MTHATQPTHAADFPRSGEVEERLSGPNFSLVRLGGVPDLMRYGVRHPLLGQTIRGKTFLKELLGLTGMEISFGVIPAHESIPFHHKHRQNEEVYLFLKGKGQFQVDGQVVDVSEGTVVRVSPDGVRRWRNTSSEDLFYVVVQAKAGSLEQWTGTDGVGVPGTVEWPAAG